MSLRVTTWVGAALLVGLLPLGACEPNTPDDPFPGAVDPTPTPTPIPAEGAESESNDAVATADVLMLGEGLSARMSPDDVDVFYLDVPRDFEGYKITVSAMDGPGDCFTQVDPWLEVRAEDGVTPLYFMEDNREHYCPVLSFVPEPGAGYYLVVGTDYDLSGAYVMRAEVGGPGTLSGLVTVSAERRGAPAAGAREVVTGEMLVRPTAGVSAAALVARLGRVLPGGATLVREVMGGRWLLVGGRPPEGLDREGRRRFTQERVARARGVPGVGAVEAHVVRRPFAQPSDPGLPDQWHYGPYPGMNVEAAWEATTGSAQTIVAVLDTGHQPDHPDLAPKASGGYDFITHPESAGDGDGPDDDPDDNLDQGHGTHVAGTVAASTNNGIGVAGVGWEVSYMPLRVCGNYGCVDADISEAIYYAAGYETVAGPGQAARRADVINLSLGGHDTCTASLQDAISAASLRGVVVVAAAGNSADVAQDYAPASCAEVIAVAASGEDERLASFSNYGLAVDVAAPGVDVLSTWVGGQYAIASGTSMAAPHVAGAVGLLKDIDPSFSFETILSLLTETATRLDDCDRVSGGCGAGLVDTAAAVERALGTPGDPARDVLVVEAINTADASARFSTYSLDGAFTLVGLPPGTYALRAGFEVNGDTSPDARVGEVDGTFTITPDGEDHDGIVVSLP